MVSGNGVTDGRMAPFSWSSMTFAMRCDTELQRHGFVRGIHVTCFPKHRFGWAHKICPPFLRGTFDITAL